MLEAGDLGQGMEGEEMLLVAAAQAPTSASSTPALPEHSRPPPPTQPQALRGKAARTAGKDRRR